MAVSGSCFNDWLYLCFPLSFLKLFSDVLISVSLAESSPRTSGPSGDDWRSAFDAAANGSVDYNSHSDSFRSQSNGHSRNSSDPAQNGDVNSGSNSSSRRTPNRLPPPPPPSGSSGYKYY